MPDTEEQAHAPATANDSPDGTSPHEKSSSAKTAVATSVQAHGDEASNGAVKSLSNSREGTPPPLPPRPTAIPSFLDDRPPSSGTHAQPGTSKRPPLQSKATTALSLEDVQSYSDGTKEAATKGSPRQTGGPPPGFRMAYSSSEAGDSMSVRSFIPMLEAGTDMESILGDVVAEQGKNSWQSLGSVGFSEDVLFPEDAQFEAAFAREFEEIAPMAFDGSNEESIVLQWRAKLKHFLILSSAGKPIYSRHGDDQLISNYIGVVQTLISFYQDAKDELRGFTAGCARFVVLSRGPLNLVAISRLGESDAQLGAQLEALYMQILSTLTLPNMERMFRTRASTDLRRPLQGTETLLSALADGFTRGSPSTLLSALECLRMRKSYRKTINDTLLKTRSPNLLYGLIVAGGKLVSVVRPKKHSLHPGDLQLIFNMLFEAGSVKAGGGENWIPLCLPGFNNSGYLYMYVSFLDLSHNDNAGASTPAERPSTSGDEVEDGSDDEVAIILISANKESFYELRQMRDNLVEQLSLNASLARLRHALQSPRPSLSSILPGSPLRHFLYKSRPLVQFLQPTYQPYFTTALQRRQLLTLYSKLHAALHQQKPGGCKVLLQESTTHTALAWTTDEWEVFCVAPGGTSRAALRHSVEAVVRWVKGREEGVFILGGAVF